MAHGTALPTLFHYKRYEVNHSSSIKLTSIHPPRVARLGVTESDWRTLGREATMGLQLEIALRCFIRVRDARMIDKLHRLHNAKRAGRLPAEDALLADLKAYLGQYRCTGHSRLHSISDFGQPRLQK